MDFLYNFLKSIGIADPKGSGWLTVALTFFLAWVACYKFLPAVRTFALEVGWADKPNARRLNKEPLPNAGGLAIYAAVIAALICATLLRPIEIQMALAKFLTILLGGSFLVLVGFIDDQYGLNPYIRLFTQILAALLLINSGIEITATFGTPFDSLLSIAITVIWVVGITNAINLMDGVDGVVGGIGFITSMSLLAVSAQFANRAASTLILAALAGASLGFLRFNFYPSRIIMGDAGAYFFGYVLAATTILGGLQVNTLFALVPIAMFLLLPVLDTTQVFIRRLMAGKNPLSTPGKDHLHHRLLALGLSQRWTAIVLWGVSLLSNLVAMRLQGTSGIVMASTIASIILPLGLTIWLRLRALRKKPSRLEASAKSANK
jgi:UDP-GlcNAc:undecaprenyl-phosphate/decaprenyl-phosphate GlcNAc-1-phosphate transferase